MDSGDSGNMEFSDLTKDPQPRKRRKLCANSSVSNSTDSNMSTTINTNITTGTATTIVDTITEDESTTDGSCGRNNSFTVYKDFWVVFIKKRICLYLQNMKEILLLVFINISSKSFYF